MAEDVGKTGAQAQGQAGRKVYALPKGAHDAMDSTLLESRAVCGLTVEAITFLCAEPGMGKTFVAQTALKHAEREGRDVWRASYAGVSSADACRRLVRGCRNFSRKISGRGNALAVLDDVPAADEAQVDSEARAIRRLAATGCQVLVCIRPEAEQLLDSLDGALCLTAEDLLFRPAKDDDLEWELSGGIPALVKALRADRALGQPHLESGARYLTALENLLASWLRPTLSDEERLMRLAMLLLGHGDLSDLRAVSVRCDKEMLQWLRRDATLFGIDARSGTFACNGIARDRIFGDCIEALRPYAAAASGLVVRTCGVLASRGDVRRSALACGLCSSDRDLAYVGSMWGVDYVSVGAARIVGEALRASDKDGLPPGERQLMAHLALESVSGTSAKVDEARARLGAMVIEGSANQQVYRRALALGACRDQYRDPRTIVVPQVAGVEDAFAGGCLDHMRAMRLIASGRFSKAFSLLVGGVAVREVETLPDALLCDDLAVAQLLSGGAPDLHEERLFRAAGSFFSNMQSARLRSYHRAVLPAAAVLMGSGVDTSALEHAASRAEMSGDALMQALLLAIASVADIRLGAYSRSHVRAERAASVSRAIGADYLLSAAELVDALAQELLGEAGAFSHYCTRAGRPGVLMRLGGIAARALGEHVDGEFGAEVSAGTPCPRDALWALNLLLNDAGEISNVVSHMIPSSWTEYLSVVRLRQSELLGEGLGNIGEVNAGVTHAVGRGTQAELLPREETLREPSEVRICVLGGLRLYVRGEQVSVSSFERRRARELVTFLTVAPGHKAQRYQVLEAIWPGEDYYRGKRRVYEATGETRRIMSFLGVGGNPLMVDRAQGTVGFDQSVVSCDIDDFEREARLALAEDKDDFWVLEHARRTVILFADGPDLQLGSFGRQAQERVRELEALYVDVSVAAGEAALRLGKTRLAVRYAQDAHRMQELREDAMILLVQALRSAGRGYEVWDIYRRFSKRLIETEGVPPSVSLRRAVERAVGEFPDQMTA